MIQRFGLIAFATLAAVACASTQSASGNRAAANAEVQIQGPHVRAGTRVRARLNRFIDSTTTPGRAQPFEAVVLSELRTNDGDVFVPYGASVRGDLVWDEARRRVQLNVATIETVVGAVPVVVDVRSGALPGETAASAGGVARNRADTRDPLARGSTPDTAGAPLSSREFRLPRGAEIELVLTRPLLTPGASVVRTR